MDAIQFCKADRMRYSKNKLSSSLALLAIVFNVLFFCNIYQPNKKLYYGIIIGVSVLYNLIFMLAAFLSSEGVKNYNKSYAITLIVIGVLQVVRIFVLPLKAFTSFDQTVLGSVPVMDATQFITLAIWLTLSATAAITAGVIGVKRSNELEKHNAFIARAEAGEEEIPDLSVIDQNYQTQQDAVTVSADDAKL